MGKYRIVRIVNEGSFGFSVNPNLLKAVEPEEVKKAGSMKEANDWWKENHFLLERGNYELWQKLQNCEKTVWRKSL